MCFSRCLNDSFGNCSVLVVADFEKFQGGGDGKDSAFRWVPVKCMLYAITTGQCVAEAQAQLPHGLVYFSEIKAV